jgi:CPA2 family monovalent cation:H+ antiporter-2
MLLGARVLPWLDPSREEEFPDLRPCDDATRDQDRIASAVIFDVSLAAGASLAGAVLAESRVNDRAAADILPLADIAAVLFFVSGRHAARSRDHHGSHPLEIAVVLAIVVVGKSAAAIAIVAVLLKIRPDVGRVVAAGLGQSGGSPFIVMAAATEASACSDEGSRSSLPWCSFRSRSTQRSSRWNDDSLPP